MASGYFSNIDAARMSLSIGQAVLFKVFAARRALQKL